MIKLLKLFQWVVDFIVIIIFGYVILLLLFFLVRFLHTWLMVEDCLYDGFKVVFANA